mmetsp:Transcript_4343/g.10655  ORF Transcript_4343/g.10655 Transcript_4343/m.10655 type:complete len:227 (+) Transcript_4343:22-702(+)
MMKADMHDREGVLEAVRQDGMRLETCADVYKGDREIVLTAVCQSWKALKWAADHLKSDHDIVLAAVRQNWQAITMAAMTCRKDREIMLTAVRDDGLALGFAERPLTSDRQIVLEAAEEDGRALQFAADELLEDTTFCVDAKELFYILRITMMSGQYVVIASSGCETEGDILQSCAAQLCFPCTGTEVLVSGEDIVPDGACVCDWPGIRPCGEITDLQIVVVSCPDG